jgi:hypothetical protein
MSLGLRGLLQGIRSIDQGGHPATRIPHLYEAATRAERCKRFAGQPSISESLDWARTLVVLGIESIDPADAGGTLHVLLKYQADIDKARRALLGAPAREGAPRKRHVDAFREGRDPPMA